jgi:2-C-methyl-D-erythritol 4-phosphate cytidylyltransferase
MRAFIILPAAGLGTRMSMSSMGAAKQYLALAGIPILIHTLRAAAAAGTAAIPVAAIYVAVRATEAARVRELLAGETAVPVHVVTGGDTRQASVSAALRAIDSDTPDDILAVHDAVRPLADSALIERVLAAAARHGAAIAGMPAIDTIKQVERTASGAIITATLPRESVVHAQTPQAFRSALLRRAFAEAEADGFTGTDEASLVERSGASVAVVQGSSANIKITQPGDLELAEFLLAHTRK